MPIKYDPDFIPRVMENKDVENILSEFSALIEETVNFASHVFRWCLDKINGEEELIPVLMSFRRIFELIDSISILIKYSSIDPCKIFLRSIFESTLYAEYIFDKDSKNRGLAFMLCYHQEMLKFHRRWDPDDPMYHQFRKNIKEDKVLKNWNTPDYPEIKKAIEKIKKSLCSDKYKELSKEYNRKKKEYRGKVNWFSLWDGPRNIEMLAEYLERSGFYQILYRQWSPAIHGTDLIKGKIVKEQSGVVINQIRLPTNAQEITKFAISFALMNIRNYIKYFVPENTHIISNWYKEEIRDKYMELLQKERIKVK